MLINVKNLNYFLVCVKARCVCTLVCVLAFTLLSKLSTYQKTLHYYSLVTLTRPLLTTTYNQFININITIIFHI